VILVVSYPGDPHASTVIELLRKAGHEVHLFDVSAFPESATLTIDYVDPQAPALAWKVDGRKLDLRPARSVWWRRPQAANPAAIADFDARMFAGNEWNEAVNGLWQLLDARWMNPPGLDDIASRKAFQLKTAAAIGLSIPRTLMTSDPDRARDFVQNIGLGRTVFKTFSATHAVWRETRLIRDAELDILDAVQLAPVIFQEYVPAGADLRITVVGDQMFPASINAENTDYPVDFRMSLGQARVDQIDLPAAVARRLRRFMTRLGLVYGAIDMRRTPDGEYVFLEVNTAGEFLFIEDRTGQPISSAVAKWLARPVAP
jgi:glutathione synthase/RimK-type ligase-like ATP-grasp enzyme